MRPSGIRCGRARVTSHRSALCSAPVLKNPYRTTSCPSRSCSTSVVTSMPACVRCETVLGLTYGPCQRRSRPPPPIMQRHQRCLLGRRPHSPLEPTNSRLPRSRRRSRIGRRQARIHLHMPFSQSSRGRSTDATTSTSSGSCVGSSLSPSCSCSAVNSDGAFRSPAARVSPAILGAESCGS
jgi:hypothetical protein